MKAEKIWLVVIGILLVLLTSPQVKLFYFDSGLRWQYILLFSFMSAFFLTPFCRSLAIKMGIMDRPNWRKIHDISTPLLGGLSVFMAFCLALLLNSVFYPGMKSLLLGGTLIFVMGLWDDIRPQKPLLKFTFQILISLFVIIYGDIRLTFFFHSPYAPVLNIPLTVLWFVGLTNAMNFFDGIDGLASGLCIIVAFFLGLMAFKTNQTALGWMALALAGACMGFMPYNFRFGKSALIFLGDAGSTFIGFILAGLGVLGRWSETSHLVSLAAPILVFGVLIFDMTYVTASRIKNRQTNTILDFLTRANKDHLHHRLLFIGFSPKEAAFIIFTISTCLGVSSLIIMDQKLIDALLGLLQGILVLGIIAAMMIKGRDRTPAEGDRRSMKRRRGNHS